MLLACLSILAPTITPRLHAQEVKKPSRKLVYKVEPEYPWDLRRAYIGGTVRLDLVISPRGTVDSVLIAGGNPILAECAVRAVKKWKYVPADSETNIRLNVEFNPRR
jgi:TonB family protein